MTDRKKIILKIDTSAHKNTTVELDMSGKADRMVKVSQDWVSQSLLPLVKGIMEKNKLKLTQITEVEVNTGPGSFTGLRVGVAVANILGWYLDIPVNGKKGQAKPRY